MSAPSITDLPSIPADGEDVSLSKILLSPVHRIAFWAAVVLPFLHVPLLVTGLESETQTLAFVVLLACNVVALLLGHPAHTE